MMIDPNARQHMGQTVDLSVNEARAALADAQWRWGKSEVGYRMVEFSHKGEWLKLVREDLAREVCSWTQWTTDKDFEVNPVEYMRRTIMFGARVRDGVFVIIDDTSDH